MSNSNKQILQHLNLMIQKINLNLVSLTHEELLGGFEEYIARRTENIKKI